MLYVFTSFGRLLTTSLRRSPSGTCTSREFKHIHISARKQRKYAHINTLQSLGFRILTGSPIWENPGTDVNCLERGVAVATIFKLRLCCDLGTTWNQASWQLYSYSLIAVDKLIKRWSHRKKLEITAFVALTLLDRESPFRQDRDLGAQRIASLFWEGLPLTCFCKRLSAKYSTPTSRLKRTPPRKPFKLSHWHN